MRLFTIYLADNSPAVEEKLEQIFLRPTVFYLGLQFKMSDRFVLPTGDLFRKLPIKVLHLDTSGSAKVCVDIHLAGQYLNHKSRSPRSIISNSVYFYNLQKKEIYFFFLRMYCVVVCSLVY